MPDGGVPDWIPPERPIGGFGSPDAGLTARSSTWGRVATRSWNLERTTPAQTSRCPENTFVSDPTSPGRHEHRTVTKEKPRRWTHRRAFAQVRRGSNIQLLPYPLVRPGRIIETPQMSSGVSARALRRSATVLQGTWWSLRRSVAARLLPDAPSLMFGPQPADHSSRDRAKGVATAAGGRQPPAVATASSHGLEGCGDLLFSVLGTRWSHPRIYAEPKQEVSAIGERNDLWAVFPAEDSAYSPRRTIINLHN